MKHESLLIHLASRYDAVINSVEKVSKDAIWLAVSNHFSDIEIGEVEEKLKSYFYSLCDRQKIIFDEGV
jgi:hypothetical protein